MIAMRFPPLLMVAAILSLGCLTGCGRPGARTVVVYTSVDQVYSEPILRSFQAQSGIEVLPVYDVEAAKTTGLVNRLIAEKGRPQADVWWNGEFAQTLLLKEKGLLAAYRSPSADDLPAQYVDPERYWTGLPGRARVILVNTDLVDPGDYPRSRTDLLGPTWSAGEVGIAYPLFGTTATEAAALYAALGPERARQFYERLRDAGVRVVDGNSVVRDLVASGQLRAGLTDSDDAHGALKRGAPVKVILPDQRAGGTLIIPGTVALIAGAPHPSAGQALVDFLAGREAERQLIESGFCQIPLRLTEMQPTWLTTGQIRGMAVSFDQVVARLPLAQQDLREVFVR
jgi:iron(III) transport system substrate-binding protein